MQIYYNNDDAQGEITHLEAWNACRKTSDLIFNTVLV